MLGRLGAVLLLVGAAATIIAVAIGLAGGTIGLAERNEPPQSTGEVMVLVAVALFGLGSLVVGGADDRPELSRTARAGLVILGVGSLCLAANTVATNMLKVWGESWPLLLLLAGLVGVPLGLVLTGVALSRAPGPARLIGPFFLLAPAGLALSAMFRVGGVYPVLLVPLGLVGVAVLVLGRHRGLAR